MKSLLFLLALTTSVLADPIVAPAGWTPEIQHPAAVPHLGSPSSTVATTSFTPPGGGLTLVVTRVTAPAPALHREAGAIRTEIDTFHAAANRAGLTGSSIEERGWQERTNTQQNLIEGTLEFHDTSQAILTSSRIVVADSPTLLVAVSGEWHLEGQRRSEARRDVQGRARDARPGDRRRRSRAAADGARRHATAGDGRAGRSSAAVDGRELAHAAAADRDPTDADRGRSSPGLRRLRDRLARRDLLLEHAPQGSAREGRRR